MEQKPVLAFIDVFITFMHSPFYRYASETDKKTAIAAVIAVYGAIRLPERNHVVIPSNGIYTLLHSRCCIEIAAAVSDRIVLK